MYKYVSNFLNQIFFDIYSQVTGVTKFHDEKEVICGVNSLVQSDHVRMAQ